MGARKSGPVEVVMLCSADFLDGRKVEYEKAEVFAVGFFCRFAGRLGALVDRSLKLIGEQWRLGWVVVERPPDLVIRK